MRAGIRRSGDGAKIGSLGRCMTEPHAGQPGTSPSLRTSSVGRPCPRLPGDTRDANPVRTIFVTASASRRASSGQPRRAARLDRPGVRNDAVRAGKRQPSWTLSSARVLWASRSRDPHGPRTLREGLRRGRRSARCRARNQPTGSVSRRTRSRQRAPRVQPTRAPQLPPVAHRGRRDGARVHNLNIRGLPELDEHAAPRLAAACSASCWLTLHPWAQMEIRPFDSS